MFNYCNDVAGGFLLTKHRNTPQGVDMRMHEKYSSPFSYALGVITTAAGVLSLDQWAVLIGIICTVATFLVNWYYKRKEFKLREANSGKNTK